MLKFLHAADIHLDSPLHKLDLYEGVPVEEFRRSTRRTFEGLRADFDESGRPVIVGLRQGGGVVTVDGMSDGTADQLYLALRLAGLEMYIEKNEPLPFVVDGILIRFDNDRAEATLKVLAELSKKTQVIFFTHHRHLVDIAENNMDASILKAYDLVNDSERSV